MPLVVCPDCGNEISDAAPLCIHCGRPRSEPEPPAPPPKRSLPWGLILTWLGGLCLSAGLALLVAGRPGTAVVLVACGLLGVFAGGVHSIVTRFTR